MKVQSYQFGEIVIEGKSYDYDVVIERGTVRKRRKKPSKPLKEHYGHTPLSEREDIPWDCRTLIVGTGKEGSLPVTDGLRKEAERRGVSLRLMPTEEAIRHVDDPNTNLVLHLTC